MTKKIIYNYKLTTNRHKFLAGLLNKQSDDSNYEKKNFITNSIIASVAALGFFLTAWQSYQTNKAIKIAEAANHISKKAADASDSALAIANRTFQVTRQYNNSSIKLQEKSFESGELDSKKREEHESLVLSETVKEFEDANRPYISYIGVKFIQDSAILGSKKVVTKRPVLIYDNYGKTPGYISILRTGLIYSTDSIINEKVNFRDRGAINIISPPLKECDIIVNTEPITIQKNAEIFYKKIFLFVFGEIDYTDVSSKHIYKSTCCFRCSNKFNGILSMDYQPQPYNERVTLKK